jgi:tetratricopeptide (TPR) repeat protein
MEEGDYQNALRYYRTFIERHPDDIQHVVEAQYEIAFLHYKQGNYAAAQEEFEKLLSYYEGGGQSVLPEWPQILGKKMLTKIESRQADAEDDADQSSEEDSSGGE